VGNFKTGIFVVGFIILALVSIVASHADMTSAPSAKRLSIFSGVAAIALLVYGYASL
jgi:hypothetical protein